MKGFNLKEFDIDIDFENRRYCIKDKITGVEYHRRNLNKEEIHSCLQKTFEGIKEYREWWYEIERKESRK